MKTVAVVTVARSDFGIYESVLSGIQKQKDLNLKLIVTGMHFEEKFGSTITEIEKSPFSIDYRLPLQYESDSPQSISNVVSDGISKFSKLFTSFQPDLLMVLGDRFEMLAAVVAAMPFRIPVVHLHGGESSEGLIDEAIRHSITKMSHLHFASTEPYRQRIIRMGEQPHRVFCSGAPSLDGLNQMEYMSQVELEKSLDLDLSKPTLLMTFHPVTLEYDETQKHIDELMEALISLQMQTVITYPNADTAGSLIIQEIEKRAKLHSFLKPVPSLGRKRYFSMLKFVKAMVGNSSSGIIEAASFHLPVVDIGNRQRGRIHSTNLIHCGHSRAEILEALKKAVSPEMKQHCLTVENPYFRKNSGAFIAQTLAELKLDQSLIEKKFYE